MMDPNTQPHVGSKDTLRMKAAEFESLFTYNPNMVYTINHEGQFTNVNPAALERLGYTFEEITAMHFNDVVAETDRARTYHHFLLIMEGHVQSFQIQIHDRHGDLIDVDITAVPTLIEGQVSGMIGTAIDITERLLMERKLRISEETYRALFDHNVDSVTMYDLEGKFISFNQATEKLLGAKSEELAGKSFVPFLDDAVRDETVRHFKQALNGVPHQYETVVINGEGEKVYMQINLIPAFVNQELTSIHCIAKDITYLKQHDEMLRKMAYYDSLTGLGNQRLFTEDLRMLMTQQNTQELALWIINLDRFKFINDHFGHRVGDQLLSLFASRLQSVILDKGRVYRYGGDEFAVIVPDTDELTVRLLAEQMMSELNRVYELEGIQTVLTVSMGISFYPRHASDEINLVRSADHAMYHVKRQGRNTYQLYTADIQGLTDSDMHMESLLRKAIENKEFLLHYQPQYDAKSGKIVGVEALVRWHNEELGWVSPATFIPIAEESGLIVPIGEWVIEEACRQHVEWQNQGLLSVPIAVNLSLRQFYQSDLLEKIHRTLLNTGMDPFLLTLEITETIAMQEDIAIEVLNQLHELGVGIAMDDFGTGYSSLQYLQRFSIDHIKIDKAFTDQLDTQEGRAIISTIISLGHNLKMKVVAEGVETAHQAEELTSLGCDVFQGYHFSRPLPPLEFVEELRMRG